MSKFKDKFQFNCLCVPVNKSCFRASGFPVLFFNLEKKYESLYLLAGNINEMSIMYRVYTVYPAYVCMIYIS